MKYNRLKAEKEFHDKRFANDERDRESVGKFYSVNKSAKETFYNMVKALCDDKKLIEYGCADGLNLEIFAKFGANVTGIDISGEGIKKSSEKMEANKINAECLVMDVEKTEFRDNSFDIATGMGIIHHLDIIKVYTETSRILNENGHAIFFEPLGHNPLFNLFRKLTPKIRTKDEHPLIRKDLRMLKEYFNKVEIKYFSLLTLLAVPFREWFIFNPLYDFLSTLDKFIFKIPYLKEWAWVAVIHVQNPIKSNSEKYIS